MASSYISASDEHTSEKSGGRRLLKRLALFLSPILIPGIIVGTLLVRAGEILPASTVAWLQTFSRPFIYLPQFTDHSFQFKVSAAKLVRPDVLIMGASRSNQWRSAMFKPSTFYNGGSAVFSISNFIAMMDEWGDYSPRVVILTIDYFMFIDAFDRAGELLSKNDKLSWKELALVLKGTMEHAVKDPGSLVPNQRDPIYGVPALGITAQMSGTGARLDGSYQYGHAMVNGGRGSPSFPVMSLEKAVELIREGDRWPLQAGDEMTAAHRLAFERFVKLAHNRNITLVGVTPPFEPEILTELWASPYHGAFRQFHSPQTSEWLASLGVIYFDFSKLSSINGKSNEFVDPYHPSEPAYLRMLLKMMESPRFAKLFPKIDTSRLKDLLSKANRLEVFKNEF